MSLTCFMEPHHSTRISPRGVSPRSHPHQVRLPPILRWSLPISLDGDNHVCHHRSLLSRRQCDLLFCRPCTLQPFRQRDLLPCHQHNLLFCRQPNLRPYLQRNLQPCRRCSLRPCHQLIHQCSLLRILLRSRQQIRQCSLLRNLL
jgi:hypothetical protein